MNHMIPLPHTAAKGNPAGAVIPDRARAQINWCVWCFFWLLLFEGVLRKWIFPAASDYLIFLRDPLVLIIYGIAARYGVFPRTAGVAFLAILSIISLLAGFFVIPGSPLTLLIGYRTTFGYFPLIFLIARTFGPEDLRKLGNAVLWIALPLAALLVFQYEAPRDSILNVAAGGSEGQIGSAGGRIRPPGPFTFFTGTANFLALWLAILVYRSMTERLNPIFLGISAIAMFTGIATSGSRTVIVWSLLIVLVALLTTARSALKSLKVVVLVLLFTAAGLILSQTSIIGESVSTTMERAIQATDDEGGLSGVTQTRILEDFIRPFELIDRTPELGYGLGVGTAAAGQMLFGRAGSPFGRDGEREWARMVLESGHVLGFLAILYRLGLGLFLLRYALFALRLGAQLPLILFAVYGFNLVNGNFGQPTMQGFTVLVAGLGLAYSIEAIRGLQQVRNVDLNDISLCRTASS